MDALTPPLLMAAGLLVLAGAPKLVRPEATERALAGVGLPSRSVLVRALGLAEIAIGVAALTVGGRLPALGVAAAYLGFAGFVAYARSRGGASCGCLGADATPPTRLHLALDGGAGIVALLAAFGSPDALTGLVASEPATGWPLLGLVLLGTWFLYLALLLLPQLAVPEQA